MDYLKLGIKCLIHTSHSHDPDNNVFKYRVLIQLNTPLPSADYEDFYDYFCSCHPLLQEWNDKKWLDNHGRTISQLFHYPSCHPDRESTARMDIIDGEPYDIAQYENYVLMKERCRPKNNI